VSEKSRIAPETIRARVRSTHRWSTRTTRRRSTG